MKTSDGYAYSGEPTRNPFRYLLALWRSFRDLTNTEEAAIVETVASAQSRALATANDAVAEARRFLVRMSRSPIPRVGLGRPRPSRPGPDGGSRSLWPRGWSWTCEALAWPR